MSDLPVGWEWATLGDIAESIQNGIFVSRPGSDPDGVPILRISSVRTMQLDLSDLRYSGIDAKVLAAGGKLLAGGDLLFTRYSGSREFVGACARVPDDLPALTYPDKLIRARVRHVDSRYLEMAFASPVIRSSVERVLRTTAGQVGISGSALKGIRIPIAPAAEQQRIVTELDGHLSRLNAGSTCLHQGDARFDDLHASALNYYHSNASIGDVPLVAIGELSETRLGKMLDAKKMDGVATQYLRNVNVRWHSFDLTDLAQVPLTDAERSKFDLQDGDVLVCEGGEPGRSAVWHDQVPGLAFQKALHRVRVRNKIRPEWLCMMLEAEVRSGRVAPLLTGSTIKHLPQEKLRAIKIPVPSIDQQDFFIREFGSLLAGATRTKNHIKHLTRNAGLLHQSLLAEAFAGRLVPQDPDEEPAAVLLARIRAERAAHPRTRRSRSTTAP